MLARQQHAFYVAFVAAVLLGVLSVPDLARIPMALGRCSGFSFNLTFQKYSVSGLAATVAEIVMIWILCTGIATLGYRNGNNILSNRAVMVRLLYVIKIIVALLLYPMGKILGPLTIVMLLGILVFHVVVIVLLLGLILRAKKTLSEDIIGDCSFHTVETNMVNELSLLEQDTDNEILKE